jgi:hypothetical protein
MAREEDMDRTRDWSSTAAADASWLGLVERMFRLPVEVMAYTVEMFAATLRGAFRLTEEGPAGVEGSRHEGQPGTRDSRVPIDRKEDRQMSDTHLADEQVKLVRYTIVFVKRDQEEILEQDEILVTDDLTPEGFASWRIAVYFQGEHEPIAHEDKKYLRVCYEVLCRWVREPLHYEKRQLDELRGIREAIEEKNEAERGGRSPAERRPRGAAERPGRGEGGS